MAATDLTAARLREWLSYDPATGAFVWLRIPCSNIPAGTPAGAGKGSHGYRHIRVEGRLYRSHRLAWLHVYGAWPNADVDHINGVRDDNRIANLRDVSRQMNVQNTMRIHRDKAEPLPLGVRRLQTKSRLRKPFYASLGIDGKRLHLGYFATPEEAGAAYLAAKRRLHAGFVG